jgi:uncharacterized linocin/CFP29 family protein
MDSSDSTMPTGQSSPANPEEDLEAQSLYEKENAKVGWSDEIWKAIHRTVHDETMRVRVGAKFLPHRRVHPKTTSVQPDQIQSIVLPGDPSGNNTLTVDEGQTIRLNEIWAEFALTTQQVHETAEAKYPEHTTAVTLARRAAQYLALAQDFVIFQGQTGYDAPFFQQNIRTRSSLLSQLPTDFGLLSLNPSTAASPPASVLAFSGNYASTNPLIQVFPLNASPPAPGVTWGENTFSAVTQGYANLTSQGQAGPYALILNTVPYADLYAAVGLGSLVITADRIAPLVKAGLFGTGTIPQDVSVPTSPPTSPPGALSGLPSYGVMVSLGGDTMDLVTGLHATTVFMQQDTNQMWRFRVLERFALRVMDPSAIQVFEFLPS